MWKNRVETQCPVGCVVVSPGYADWKETPSCPQPQSPLPAGAQTLNISKK